MSDKKTRLTGNKLVISNLVKKYGLDKVQKLVDSFVAHASGAEIAKEFGVTRQRVNQWRKALGSVQKIYCLDPDVAEVLEGFEATTDKLVPSNGSSGTATFDTTGYSITQ